MSVNSKMTAIADAIRAKTGINGTLTLDEMATAIASIEVDSGEGITVTSVSCDIVASNGKLIGDVNGDGKVDSADEELAAQKMTDGEYDAAADFDGDGEITVSDMFQFSSLVAELKAGQIIAKAVIEYSNGEKASGYFPIDAPSFGGSGESGKTIKSVSCTTTVSSGVLIGDMNNDGIIDSADEELASQCMMDGGYNAAIDFDGDGVIGVADMVQFSGVLAELEEGQIIAKITIVYSDGTSRIEYKPVDKGKIPSGGTSNVVHFDAITSDHGFDVDICGIIATTQASSTNSYMVKASNKIYSKEELIGKTITLNAQDGSTGARQSIASVLISNSSIIDTSSNGSYMIIANGTPCVLVVQHADAGAIMTTPMGATIPPSAGTYLVWSADVMPGLVITAEINVSGELEPYATEICNVDIKTQSPAGMLFYGNERASAHITVPSKFNAIEEMTARVTYPLTIGKGRTFIMYCFTDNFSISTNIRLLSMFAQANQAWLMFQVMGDGEINIG